MEPIFARDKEISELESLYKSGRSEFAIIYGRRRIGKTFLINSVFSNRMSFHYTGGRNVPQDRQLLNFANALQKFSESPFFPVFKDWFEAFNALAKYLESTNRAQKKVIFIDEMPWIDTVNSNFVTALENFWNSWAALRDDILFIACGSATSWMVDKLVDNQGGLHNRITSRIYLRPFYLEECEQYLKGKNCFWERYQIVQCYMILGGIPFYLSLLDPTKPLAENIDNLFFSGNAKLDGEFDELYNALFNSADNYVKVVRILAEKREGLTRQEILDKSKISGGTLTKILKNLERCDFIIGYSKFKTASKNVLYRIVDFYTLFYFKHLENNRSYDKQYWTHISATNKINAWQGYSFELVCLTHVDQMKKSLGVSGILINCCSWRSNEDSEFGKAQIDLLLVRPDKTMYVCEMKFAPEDYVITKSEEEKFRRRMAILKAETNTKYSMIPTFVTPYGILRNSHSAFVMNDLKLEDLFVKL